MEKQNYSGYGAAESTKKKETEKSRETEKKSQPKRTAEYANELAKLVPSVEFKIGSSLSTAKNGKTLTINPKLLEKMQNDPEQEKETKELIRGVESAMNLIESINRASGWTVVYKHSYIDENGKYHSVGHYRNDYMLNMSDKLREERRYNLSERCGYPYYYGSCQRRRGRENRRKRAAARMEELVRKNNPGWKPGDAFDGSILDQLDGTFGGVDFKA